MGVRIRYMGAKHQLAPKVAEKVSQLPEGPCLDLFSGMCSVAGALANYNRPAWCNDIQQYAATVARAVTSSTTLPPTNHLVASKLEPLFEKNLHTLEKRFESALAAEKRALDDDDHETYKQIVENWRHVGNDADLKEEAAELRKSPGSLPYRLTAITFSHGYFGLRQAIEIDSLKYAIDKAAESGSITEEEEQWLTVAILQTASQIVSAPGHFAQFLKVSSKTYPRIRRLRSRSVWDEFFNQFESLSPYGESEWRQSNRVFQSEAVALTKELLKSEERPAVVYADPPYSKAQYSRYYHVLETLVKYDYPSSSCKGRYRDDRFRTSFSHRSAVKRSFQQLIKGVAQLGASFVLSYPSNGLLYKIGHDPKVILKQYFAYVDVEEIDYQHSTMGGAPGHERSDVEEKIFVAKNSA